MDSVLGFRDIASNRGRAGGRRGPRPSRLRSRRPTSAWDILDSRILLTTNLIPVTFNVPAAVANQGVYVAIFGLEDPTDQYYLTTDGLSGANNLVAASSVQGSISQSDTSITVNSVDGFPQPSAGPGYDLLITQRDANQNIIGSTTVAYSSVDPGTNSFQLTTPVGTSFSTTQGSIQVALQEKWTATSTLAAGTAAPLLNLFPDIGTYQGTASATVYLPRDVSITSGEMVMFVGPHTGLLINSALELPVPSVGSNPNDTFGLFEWGLNTSSTPSTDYDVSAIDQVGVPFQVTSLFPNSQNSSAAATPPAAPYNDGVGFVQDRETVFNGFTPYVTSSATNSQASIFLDLAPNSTESTQRITAPQDLLNFVLNSGPSFANPGAGIVRFQPVQTPAGTNTNSYGVNPTSIVVYPPGSGYASNTTTVTFSAPSSGTTATGTAVITGGSVTGITLTNPGSGYTTAPSITINSTGSGSGAMAAAGLNPISVSYVITALRPLVTITNGGSQYAEAPTVTFSAPPSGGTTAQGTAILGTGAQAGQVVAVQVTDPGTGYLTAPTLSFSQNAVGTSATASVAFVESMAGTAQPTQFPSGTVAVLNWNAYLYASEYNIYRITNGDVSGEVRLNGNTPFAPASLPAGLTPTISGSGSATTVTINASDATFLDLPKVGTLLITEGTKSGYFQYTSASYTPATTISPNTITFTGTMFGSASFTTNATIALLPNYTDTGLPSNPLLVQPPINNNNYEPLNQYYNSAVEDFFNYYRTNEFEIDLSGLVSTEWKGYTRDDVVLDPSLLTAALTPSSTQLTISDTGVDIANLPASGTLEVSQVIIQAIQSDDFNYTSFVDVSGTITFTGTTAGTNSFFSDAAVALPESARYTALVLVGSAGTYGHMYAGNVAYILQPFFNSNVAPAALPGVANLSSPLPSYITDVTPSTSPAEQVFGSNGVFDTGFSGATLGGSDTITAPVSIQEDIMNPINAALDRGLTPRSQGSGWVNVIAPDDWANNPTLVTASVTSTTAGSLAQGTYYYAVTGTQINGEAVGETVLSNIVTVSASSLASAPTNTVTISIPNQGVTTFAKFNIYRGTTPDNLKLIGSVTDNLTGVTTYPDNGSSQGTTPPTAVINAPGQTVNWYAAYLHQLDVSVNGYAYGFPYDDQGGQSTNVSIAAIPQSLIVAINPFTAASPTVSPSTASLVRGQTLTIQGTGFDVGTLSNNTVMLTSASGTVYIGSVTSVNPDGTQLQYTFLSPPSLGAVYAVVQTPDGDSGPAVQVATLVPSVTPLVIDAPSTFSISQNMTGNLLWPSSITAFTGNNSAPLVVTLSIVDGSINAASSQGVTVTGTGLKRILSGTPADLNAYFATPGLITYTPAPGNINLRILTTTATDGAQVQWFASIITLIPTPGQPALPTPSIALLANVFSTSPNHPFSLILGGTPFVDAGTPAAELFTVRLQSGRGGVSARSSNGVTVSGSSRFRIFKGTLASLNAYFTSTDGHILYRPGKGSKAPRLLTTTLVEGQGANLSTASTTIQINVTSQASVATLKPRHVSALKVRNR